MRAFGNNREDCKMDQKRRYANCAPRAGDLREERAAKRKTRTEGEAEIREAVACMAAADYRAPPKVLPSCRPLLSPGARESALLSCESTDAEVERAVEDGREVDARNSAAAAPCPAFVVGPPVLRPRPPPTPMPGPGRPVSE